jgi:hypothetical protein
MALLTAALKDGDFGIDITDSDGNEVPFAMPFYEQVYTSGGSGGKEYADPASAVLKGLTRPSLLED